MLVEKSLKEALGKHIAGREVLVMSIGTTDGSGSIMVDKLEEYFKGCRFLVEVPAVVDPEFDAAFTDKTPPPIKEPAKEVAVVENKQETIARLQAEGLSAKEISNKTGIPYGTVYYYLHPEKCGKKTIAGSNADRKKCKSCQYRGIKNGCDYIELVGHSRGCSVEDCSVYKKGARQGIKKSATDRLGV